MPTLGQLENLDLGEPQPEDSALIRRCRVLVTTDPADFTVEDLRVMVGQRLGLRTLLPLAVRELERDLLAEGDYHPGDLLVAVLRLPGSLWASCPAERDELSSLLSAFHPEDPELRREVTAFLSATR